MASVTHSTLADNTFSPAGKAAWEAGHVVNISLSDLGIWYGSQAQYDNLTSEQKTTFADWSPGCGKWFEFHIFLSTSVAVTASLIAAQATAASIMLTPYYTIVAPLVTALASAIPALLVPNYSGGSVSAPILVAQATAQPISLVSQYTVVSPIIAATATAESIMSSPSYGVVSPLVTATATAAAIGLGASYSSAPTTPVITATVGDTTVTIAKTSGGVGATSYDIHWGTTSGSRTNTISSVSLPYTHTGRTNGTTYYYSLVAINGSGSTESTEVPAVADYFGTGNEGFTLSAGTRTAAVGEGGGYGIYGTAEGYYDPSDDGEGGVIGDSPQTNIWLDKSMALVGTDVITVRYKFSAGATGTINGVTQAIIADNTWRTLTASGITGSLTIYFESLPGVGNFVTGTIDNIKKNGVLI